MNKNHNKVIVIGGDSWGCGEWSICETGYGISHPGLSKYLTDSGYLVINLSHPGGSNVTTVDRIGDFLTLSTHLSIAHVFVFQTEWPRDVPQLSIKYSSAGYKAFKMQFINKFYSDLSKISQDTKIPIHLIGGCSDTEWLDDSLQKYPGINMCCQSFTNLLLTGDHRIKNPVYSVFKKNSEHVVMNLRKNIDNTEDLELLLIDIEQGSRRFSQWGRERSFFWPDGGHANQNSHAILFEFLKNQIADL